MKKILAICMLIMLGPILAIGQPYGNETPQLKQDLLEKSKRQRKTGFILLGVGAASAVAGAIIFDNNFTLFSKSNDDAAGAGAIMFLAGGLSMIGSIPLFVASSRNSSKAAELKASIKVEMGPQLLTRTVAAGYPAVTLRWRIK